MKVWQSKTKLTLLFLVAVIGAIFWWNTSTSSDTLPERVDFNFHIKPIISNNCFTCHGPDKSTREASLRLDTQEGMTALLPSGMQAVVPGKPKASAILHRLQSDDQSLVMPPPETNKQLTTREIKLIKKWIAQGAEWKKHWALIPPKDPIKEKRWAKKSGHPIDLLVNFKRKENGLNAAAKAKPAQLHRRLAFTLTGLPPSEQESKLAGNFDHLVNYYLDSPHFGEHWARHWMDLVRYADTKGHEFDFPIVGAWRYRDYLIRAFNEDVPYDQFIKEQLAGDLLANPRMHPEAGFNESILGTVFYTLGEGKHSPVDIKKEEIDRTDNIIDVCTKSFQALTVSCARCHDHKFDPIPTADYYALYGIFESTRFSVHPATSGMHAYQLIDTLKEISDGVKEWIAKVAHPKLKQPKATFTRQASSSIREDSLHQVIGDFRNGDNDGWFAEGPAFAIPNSLGWPIWDEANFKLLEISTGKASGRMAGEGLIGSFMSPTFTIEKDKLLVRASGKNSEIRVVIDNFQLIRFPIYEGLKKDVDSDEMTDFIFDVGLWKGKKAYIELTNGRYTPDHNFDIKKDAWIEAEYAIAFNGQPFEPPINNDNTSTNFALNNWLQNKAKPKDIQQLNAWIKQGLIAPDLTSHKTSLEQVPTIQAQLRDSSFIAGVTKGDQILSPVFIRGDHNQLEDQTESHRFLSCLPSSSGADFNKNSRLALASAIADSANPLTARVYVNRVWHHLFGTGIVPTVDNFGLQGEIPNHPELLDHLAVWFIEHGWSTKALIRYIVQSQTFQLSTQASKKSRKLDPQNKLLQHFPVRRLDAESIRDAILVSSGGFDSTLFGPSVPIHLTEFMKGRGRPSVNGPLDGAGRRSIYISVRRNFLHPFLLAFDFPIPFTTFGKRNDSNVPAQSLTLMNDPFVTAEAKRWAENIVQSTADQEARIKHIFETALQKPPSSDELDSAKLFLKEQAKEYGLTAEETSTHIPLWADFCHAVFNMKAFIYLI